MTEESPEGFAKRGTTLEGRVAQLLRLMGYNVSRSHVIEGHEIDVYGETDGKRIIVECKEYYTQLIPRDLILIFATKVRDIHPDEAWFVTINDFEPSALELCRRYDIRSVNGYDLEEFEDEAIKQKGDVNLGNIPPEDRYLRRLNRRRTELSREKRRSGEIRRVIDQINSLRIQRIDLPPYLFPATERDLEEKYIWLSDLEKMPKRVEDGSISDIIVNLGGQPQVRGFKITKEKEYPLALPLILGILGLSFLLIFLQGPLNLQYYLIPIILSIVVYYFRDKITHNTTQIMNRRCSDAEVGRTSIFFPRSSEPFVDDPGDISSQDLFDLDMQLVDKTNLGESIDLVVEKGTWMIRGVQVQVNQEIAQETGVEKSIIPIKNLEFLTEEGQHKIKVNALYVLGDTFFTERKQV